MRCRQQPPVVRGPQRTSDPVSSPKRKARTPPSGGRGHPVSWGGGLSSRGWGPDLGLVRLSSRPVLTWQRASERESRLPGVSSQEALLPSQGPRPQDFIKPRSPPRVPPPHTITWGVRASKQEFGDRGLSLSRTPTCGRRPQKPVDKSGWTLDPNSNIHTAEKFRKHWEMRAVSIRRQWGPGTWPPCVPRRASRHRRSLPLPSGSDSDSKCPPLTSPDPEGQWHPGLSFSSRLLGGKAHSSRHRGGLADCSRDRVRGPCVCSSGGHPPIPWLAGSTGPRQAPSARCGLEREGTCEVCAKGRRSTCRAASQNPEGWSFTAARTPSSVLLQLQ